MTTQRTSPITSDRQRRYFRITLENPLPPTNAKNFGSTFNYHLQILAAFAGIQTHITLHSGRHTLGSFLVDADVSEESSKKILGVKSNRTIRTYRHLKEEKLRSEVTKLNNIFRCTSPSFTIKLNHSMHSIPLSFYHNNNYFEGELIPDFETRYQGIPNLFEIRFYGKPCGLLRYYGEFCYDEKPDLKGILGYIVCCMVGWNVEPILYLPNA